MNASIDGFASNLEVEVVPFDFMLRYKIIGKTKKIIYEIFYVFTPTFDFRFVLVIHILIDCHSIVKLCHRSSKIEAINSVQSF